MATNERNTEPQENKGKSGPDASTNHGPVSGSAENTRGKNVPSEEGTGGGAKKEKFDPEAKSPQGSNANPTTTTRGADSTDKEFRNNQPNASTLQGDKTNRGVDDDNA